MAPHFVMMTATGSVCASRVTMAPHVTSSARKSALAVWRACVTVAMRGGQAPTVSSRAVPVTQWGVQGMENVVQEVDASATLAGVARTAPVPCVRITATSKTHFTFTHFVSLLYIRNCQRLKSVKGPLIWAVLTVNLNVFCHLFLQYSSCTYE